ncbi:MAG: hypothetical protein AAFV95_02305 [Bacteroidota bacterium]
MKKIFQPDRCLSQEDIRRYLREELDEDTQYQLENHLLDCPLCSDAVEGYATHYNFEEDKQLEELQTHFSSAPKPAKATVAKERSLWPRLAAAAAAVLLLTTAIWQYANHQAEENLYLAYHESFVPENLSAIRSADGQQSSTDENFLQATKLYQAQDYAASIPPLERHLAQDSEDVMATLLLGLAYLEEGKSQQAIDKLEIVRLNSSDYYEDASWYAALAYLQADQAADARLLLQDLRQLKDGFYQAKIEELLSKLEAQ